VPVPALRVEIVAQARHYSRVVPGTGTILTGPGRAWTVLFRAVPGPAHRVSAKWPSIGMGAWRGVHATRPRRRRRDRWRRPVSCKKILLSLFRKQKRNPRRRHALPARRCTLHLHARTKPPVLLALLWHVRASSGKSVWFGSNQVLGFLQN
jgi:hypothetical protein